MNLGEVLSSARKDSAISLEDLASALSIRPGLLMEMERNDFQKCGGDVYARGHLRNIAPILGLDSTVLIDLYNEEHSLESVSLNTQLAENNVARVPQEKRSISWKVPAAFSISALLIVATVQIIVSNNDQALVAPIPTSTASAEPSPPAITTAAPTTPAATPTSAAPLNSNISLKLTASAAARIDIVIDGTHVFKGEIAAGESKSFDSDTSISVYLSDAGAIDITLNGEDLGTLGGAGEILRRTFR